MTLHFAERTGAPNVVEAKLSGKLKRDDTRSLIPRFEQVFEAHGSVRLLVDLSDLRGWIPGLLWEDLPVEALRYPHLERIAVVGDPKWQEAMATLSKPFRGARVRYFDLGEIDSARAWLEGP